MTYLELLQLALLLTTVAYTFWIGADLVRRGAPGTALVVAAMCGLNAALVLKAVLEVR